MLHPLRATRLPTLRPRRRRSWPVRSQLVGQASPCRGRRLAFLFLLLLLLSRSCWCRCPTSFRLKQACTPNHQPRRQSDGEDGPRRSHHRGDAWWWSLGQGGRRATSERAETSAWQGRPAREHQGEGSSARGCLGRWRIAAGKCE